MDTLGSICGVLPHSLTFAVRLGKRHPRHGRTEFSSRTITGNEALEGANRELQPEVPTDAFLAAKSTKIAPQDFVAHVQLGKYS